MSSLRRLESVRRLEQMKHESSGPISFGQKLCLCCMGGGTVGLMFLMIIVLLGLFGLTIAKIVIGSLYLHDCPAQPLVPIYLIVGGVVSLVLNCSCRPSRNDEGSISLTCQGCGAVVGALTGLFCLSWLIAGTVFVVQTRQAVEGCTPVMTTTLSMASTTAYTTTTLSPATGNMTTSSTESSTAYTTSSLTGEPQGGGCPSCHEGLLTFAFAIVITEWCFGAFLILICCCVCCLPFCLALCAPSPDV